MPQSLLLQQRPGFDFAQPSWIAPSPPLAERSQSQTHPINHPPRWLSEAEAKTHHNIPPILDKISSAFSASSAAITATSAETGLRLRSALVDCPIPPAG
ncbi:hypothetical protein GFS31_27880 [Leptolyngbya sp. BL0902]|nr:hypothetical protein GFS31_27880 [Leptolyngbya sp. BL0902]